MTSEAKPTPQDRANKSVEPRVSTQETREMLVSLYVRGATNDAKAMYSASPGATDAGWQILERLLSPVKSFIADGGTPYTEVAVSTEYAGIPTPPPEEEPEGQARSSKKADEEEDEKPVARKN